MLPYYLDLQFAFLSYSKLTFKILTTIGMGQKKSGLSVISQANFALKPGKSNFETDNEKIFNITELAMLRVMTMMTGELDATDLLLNFSDFNFRNGLK